MQDSSLQDDDDDDDDSWVRRFAYPEEYIIARHPLGRGSVWRWFQSENVVDLVKIRRERAVAAECHRKAK
jgi:hypothetical protein